SKKWTGESRRRASYSTTMSLPDTDAAPRPRGHTFVSILNVVPSPGIFAKMSTPPRDREVFAVDVSDGIRSRTGHRPRGQVGNRAHCDLRCHASLPSAADGP